MMSRRPRRTRRAGGSGRRRACGAWRRHRRTCCGVSRASGSTAACCSAAGERRRRGGLEAHEMSVWSRPDQPDRKQRPPRVPCMPSRPRPAFPRRPHTHLDPGLLPTSRESPQSPPRPTSAPTPPNHRFRANRGVDLAELSPPAGEVGAQSRQCKTFEARCRTSSEGCGMSRRCHLPAPSRSACRSARLSYY